MIPTPRIVAAGILGAMLALAALPLRAEGGRRIALVIGVDAYASLSPLRGAALDASRMAQWLSHSGYDLVRLISSLPGAPPPVAADIQTAMTSIRSAVGADPVDEIAFFFSGHGFALGGSERLCLSDTVAGGSQGSIGLNEDLLPWMRGFHPRLGIAFIDACRDEAASSLPTPPQPQQRAWGDSGRSSILVLEAATPGSVSRERPDGEGGYFTQSLLDALIQTDGSLASLLDFMTRNLPARTLADFGLAQTPGIAGDFDPSLTFSAARPALAASGKRLGELIVTTQPSGAQVWCGSRYLGLSPLVWAEAIPGNFRLTAKYRELSAECSVDIAPGSLTSTELLLAVTPGRVFFGTDRKLLEYSIDGAPFRPMKGQAWIEVPPGKRSIRVLAESSLYWEGSLDVASDRTIQVVPDFVPSGRISIALPKGALLYLRSADASRDYLFAESGSLDALPVGNYHAETGDDRYLKWQGDFALTPGGSVSLAPRLVPTDLGKKLFEMEGLERRLPSERNLRFGCDIAAWAAIGASVALCVAGSFALGDWMAASRSYSTAALGADFASLRSSVLGAQIRTTILFSTSALAGLTGGLLFPLGPHPDATSRRLEAIRAELGGGAGLP